MELEVKVYTVEQVAEQVQLSTVTIKRMINEKKIHAVKIGGQWRIPVEEVKKLITEGA